MMFANCQMYSFKSTTLLVVLLTLALLSGFSAQSVAAAETAKPTTPSAERQADPLPDPLAPIFVGPREMVGKPGLAEKAAASAVGGLVGSVFGGSSRKQAQPKTLRDPSRKIDYNNLAAENFDTETQARGLWTKEGLLISSRIEDSPGKGTFQTLFLESCDGRRLYPQRLEIYDLWNESSISVSWSKTSTSNGRVTHQQSGGWDDSWSKDFSSINQSGGAAVAAPGAWQTLGFDRAQGGVRQIGAYFNLSPEQLASMGEVGLFVHTTRPTQEPVTTAPAHWLLVPGTATVPQLTAVMEEAGNAGNVWQNAARVCGELQPLLVASATALPIAAAATAVVNNGGARTGLTLPAGLELVTAKGTGRTTGHIADLDLRNRTEKPIAFPAMTFLIPSSGTYQPYVGKVSASEPIPAGGTQTIPVTGYCVDIHRPPVPDGDQMPPLQGWVVVSDTDQAIRIPDHAGAAKPPGRGLIPGTDTPLPRAISTDEEPLLAAPLLVAALAAIELKTDELQASGDLQTPYSGNPQREKESVIQQTFWIFAAEMEGEPYTKEEFTERLEQQYEDRSGIAITAAPPEDQQRVQKGADDFWDSFELVGVEAKVLANNAAKNDVAAPASGAQVKTEARPAPVPGAKVPVEVVKDDCPAEEHIHHSPRQVNVSIADSYGDAESRKKIADGIQAAVESQDAAQAYFVC